MKKYTGLSLSFCVKDICQGKVSINQVEKIITGTMAKSNDDWDNLLKSYCQNYWYDYPEMAKSIVNQLKESGKILQPRLEGIDAPLIYDGYWLCGGVKVYLK
jgi:hypothetical protein